MGVYSVIHYECDRCGDDPSYPGCSADIVVKSRVITVPGSNGKEVLWLCEKCNKEFHEWLDNK